MTNAQLQQQQQQLTIAFNDWFNDGNVHAVGEGLFSTQDAQWNNRLTLTELREYFIREFYPQETLRNEIEVNGKWIQVGKANVTPFWIHCESGEITEGECIFDTYITDNDGLDYFDDMTDGDVKRMSYYFPKSVNKWKMKQIEEKVYAMAVRVVNKDIPTEDALAIYKLANEIIALTK